MVVLSGSLRTRRAYIRDPGHHPAVALDAAGRVVEVHDSGDGHLWYWTGELISPSRVRWHRHGRYDSGQNPAVALTGDGVVIEVHEDPDPGDNRLWYRVGRLTSDFELEWSRPAGRSFPNADEGVNPSVRILDAATKLVREVHQSPRTGKRWYWNGRWRPSGGWIAWTRGADGGETQDPFFEKARAVSDGREIGVSSGSDRNTLLARAGSASPQPIRYQQTAFVESQRDDGRTVEGARFFAATAQDAAARSWAEARRREGKLVRLWQFNHSLLATHPPPSFPATDHPAAGWYRDYCAGLAAVT
jgi:hypothetical protein